MKPVAAIITEPNGTFTVLKCDGEASSSKRNSVLTRPILSRKHVATMKEAIRQADRIEWKYW